MTNELALFRSDPKDRHVIATGVCNSFSLYGVKHQVIRRSEWRRDLRLAFSPRV